MDKLNDAENSYTQLDRAGIKKLADEFYSSLTRVPTDGVICGDIQLHELMRRVERAASDAGILAVERIDASQRYIEAPMPAWYVREHCDVM